MQHNKLNKCALETAKHACTSTFPHLHHHILCPTEAPALEEALRAAGFGIDEDDLFHNPVFNENSDKGSSSIPGSNSGVIPASAARRITVRPKRSSIAVVADAGKKAKKSVFESAANTATLTAGMVSHAQLIIGLNPAHVTAIAESIIYTWALTAAICHSGNKQALESHDHLCNAYDHA